MPRSTAIQATEDEHEFFQAGDSERGKLREIEESMLISCGQAAVPPKTSKALMLLKMMIILSRVTTTLAICRQVEVE